MAQINFEGENPRLYRCGSQRLSHAIITRLGQVPIKTIKHPKNGKIITSFILTKELSQFLKEWTANNPNKKENRNG